jgi:hypothetical protein
MQLSRKKFRGLLLGLCLLLATGAFAANKGSLQLSSPVSVGGAQLASGDYTVTWDGSGPSVELNILKGKNVVAKVPARLVDLSSSPGRDAAVVKMNGDGSRSLSEIRFSGKKYAVAIADEATGSSGSSSGSGVR